MTLPIGFLGNPGFRLIAGLIFLVAFGWLFFRLSRGAGKAVFFLLSLALGALLWVSPIMQIVAYLGLGVLLLWVGIQRKSIQPDYQAAQAIVEGGGIKRGLTPPEAAVLLEMPLNRILSIVLVGLLKKGVVELALEYPLSLSVVANYRTREAVQDIQGRSAYRRAVAQKLNVIIHPFEEPFLELLEENNSKPLSTINFTAPLRALLRHTARRVGGYDLVETREYYRKHLGRARHDVALASKELRDHLSTSRGIPAAERSATNAHRLLEHHLEWVVLDETLIAYYQNFQPRWLPWSAEGFPGWANRLEEALAQTIPDGALIVDEGDTRLALRGRDPVSAEFFKAVYNQVWPG